MPVKKQQTEAVGFNLGDVSGYSTGGGIPEGDYCWTKLEIKMHQHVDQQGVKKGAARLGCMITMVPLNGGDEREQFYSLGSKAHESWAPSSDGKGIIPVPGGPGTPPNNGTNWALLVKSLYDSGLPEGVFKSTVDVLEGIHVHMQNVPEPEERKGFQAATGEAAMDNRPKTVAIVSEIKEDGKPWEGTGGLKDAPAATSSQAAGKPNGKPATSKAAPAASAPAPSESEGDVTEAAQAAISEVLEKKPNGLPKLMLKTSTFKVVNENFGQEMAQKVTNEIFGDEKVLGAVLNEIGYTVKGANVVPA